jgi:hypothetical protein
LTVCLPGAGWLVLRWARPVVTVSEAVEAPVVQAFYSTGTVQPEREYPIRATSPASSQKCASTRAIA